MYIHVRFWENIHIYPPRPVIISPAVTWKRTWIFQSSLSSTVLPSRAHAECNGTVKMATNKQLQSHTLYCIHLYTALILRVKILPIWARTDKCTSMKWFDSHTQAWEKDGSKFYIHLTSSLQHLVGDPQLEELEHEGIVARVLWWYRGIQGIL